MTPLTALLVFIGTFLFVAIVFVIPVSYALGIASMVVFMAGGHDVVTVAQYAWSSLDSFSFLAIPFYIYAGTLMEYSGISKMLINWIGGIIGRVRGSLGIITILASMAFGVLTGSAMANGKREISQRLCGGIAGSYMLFGDPYSSVRTGDHVRAVGRN